MSDLPLVLCGPMLRKATPNAVSVFVALHRPATVHLTVWEDTAGRPGRRLMLGELATVPLGPGLHVALITARPGADTPPAWGVKCLYNLEFSLPEGKLALANPGVVTLSTVPSAAERLVYGRRSLPGFQLPASSAAGLKVLYGSCRKPHGVGEDALVLVDEALEECDRSGAMPPQVLLLTGDQIYADDVHPSLLAAAGRLEALLLGGAERTQLEQAYPGHMATNQRAALARAACFTTGGANHLVSLGEFIGMYLLVWSPTLWPAAGLDDPHFEDFYSGLVRVRRALAHVSTGMLLDDHEVTDDWNIRADWAKKVGQSPLGVRILRNALAAYAVFQHWGNAPEAFVAGQPGAVVLNALKNRAGQGAPPALDDVLGALPHQKQTLAWSWRWTDNPLVDIIALDCRTRRVYDGRNGFALMPAAGIDHELYLPSDQAKPAFSIVISPAPLLGVSLIEEVQKLAVKFFGQEAVLKYDYEPWRAGDTFDALVNRLLYRSPVVVLSGDVHYGFVASLVAMAGVHTGRRIVNCTSSALKNSSPGLVKWGRTLGGSTPHAASEPSEPVTSVTRYENGQGELFQEEIFGEPVVVPEADALALVPELDISSRRTAVFPRSNLGELTWSTKLHHAMLYHGGRRVDEASFPLQADT